ncbi:GntR family transcriptional regulator [Alloalcanivorax mobilis]|uniref:GntR family transcriptional regulator n=1 Tax=Alloalcanivorax mobilis TaxID=2019569 RepID=UPI001E402874|nr:GntR family transcriptional regulator [Alloalcanivorax mobilis]
MLNNVDAVTFQARESLSEQIAGHLAGQIIRGELLAGDRIQEMRVAGELDVSRGSVREALLILQRRHLIDILPRRGAVVKEMSEAQVRGLYELVQVLLGLVIRKAIKSVREDDLDPFIELIHELQLASAERDLERFFQLSFRFLSHAYLFAGNGFVQDVLADLQPALQRTWFMALHLDGDEMKECLSFFKALVETIFRRDVRSALEIIREFAEHQSALVQESITRARQIEAAWGGRRK